MNDLLILRRIGTNEKYYILEALDLVSKKIKLVLYDKEKDNLIFDIIVTKELYNSSFEYLNYTKKLKYEDRSEDKELDLNDYIIHKFTEEKENLRSIKYTIKNIKTGQLFTPCCGRHKNHEEFKKWGKYVNDFDLDEYHGIEGYEILDGNEYDKYILSIDPRSMVLDLSLVNLFLIRELSDYVKDLFATTSDQVDIKISYKSGRIIEVKI